MGLSYAITLLAYLFLVISMHTLVVLVVAVVERLTRDRKVAGSTPGRGAIKSTRSTQPSIPPGYVGKSSTDLYDDDDERMYFNVA